MLALTKVALGLLAFTGICTFANPVPAELQPELEKRCVDWIVPEGAGCGNAPNGAYGCSSNHYDIVSPIMSCFPRFIMANQHVLSCVAVWFLKLSQDQRAYDP